MARIAYTEDWIEWVLHPYDEQYWTGKRGRQYNFPVQSTLPPHDWYVWRPGTSDYIVVSDAEYQRRNAPVRRHASNVDKANWREDAGSNPAGCPNFNMEQKI